MWKKLPYPKPLFLTVSQQNGYCVYITDYINIWWAYYKKTEFLSHLKKINDHLEMENDDQLLQKGLEILLYPENLKKLHVTFEENTMNVSMMLSCGFPVYLDLKLAEGSKEMLFKKITQQLLKTVHDLKTSETELRMLLLKKDKEINEYKNETDVRIAKYLKSGIFNDEEHTGKHLIYEKNFGSSEIPECILGQVIDRTEDLVVVKQENELKREKVEPESQQPIKNEPESKPVPESAGENVVRNETKCEPHNVIPKKKHRKMWHI